MYGLYQENGKWVVYFEKEKIGEYDTIEEAVKKIESMKIEGEPLLYQF